jgi:putative membrane protein (TIGR04086 family)
MNRLWISFKCALTALVIMVIASAAAGILIYFTPVSETLMRPVSIGILVVSSLLGGLKAGKSIGVHGILQGLTMGLWVTLCMTVVTLLFSASALEMNRFLSTLLLVLPAGAVGGVFGVGSAQK